MQEGTELWREADAILDRLLDLPASGRNAALAALSLAPALHALVAKLLAAHDSDTGPLGRGGRDEAQATLRGRRLGRWELEHEIGHGGMAVVYRAHAVDAPAQVAAVKLLTLGAWGSGGVERFQQEQAVLARLRHAHIATLFDTGTAGDGTPWLAMALVEGVRIDEWCARRALPPRDVVRLFMDVCDAVAYAHRNLVVHRDLKPSNVLVDDDGHVRLLDFGIARLVDERTEATATQWRVLTPEYAAPEQFTGAPASTAMDVYGLGALLYRLLSGAPPRRADGASDEEVTAPSRALRGSRAAALVRGDLDAVVLKALAVDPLRRHESVGALQRDLQAWLEGRPVSARTPSPGYRFARLVARNRLAAFAVAAVVVAIIAGVGATLWQSRRANEAAAQALAEADRAKRQAERATAIKDLVLSLFEATDPEQAGGAALDSREMLKRGSASIEARKDLAPDVRLEILTTIAQAQSTMAWWDDAAASRAAGFALIDASPGLPGLLRASLHREDANVHQVLGEADAAIAGYALADAAVADDRSRDAELMRALVHKDRGNTLTTVNRFDEALAEFASADALLATLADPPDRVRQAVQLGWGATAYQAGDYATALAKLQTAYDMQRAAGEGDASLARTLNLLSASAATAGRIDDAVRYDAEGLAIARRSYPADHPSIATAIYAYGDTLRQAGRYDEAMATLDEARAMRVRIGPEPETAKIDFARVRVMLAQGRYEELVALADAIAPTLAEAQGATSPVMLQVSNHVIAALLHGDPQDRLPREFALAERRLAPDDLRWHPVARLLRWRIANACFVRGDVAAATRWLDSAIELPAGSPEYPTNALLNAGLRLRMRAAASGHPELAAAMQALRDAIAGAQGASIEAVAYAWLSVARAAQVLADDDALAAARSGLVALDRKLPLPREYAEELRALR